MRGLFTNQVLSVQPGQAISGVAGHAQTLRILRGRVWITVEGIPHDYFLHAGDTFTAIPGRLIVVEADQEASIDGRHATTRHTLRRIRLWLTAIAQRLSQGSAVQTSLKRHRTCDAC